MGELVLVVVIQLDLILFEQVLILSAPAHNTCVEDQTSDWLLTASLGAADTGEQNALF